MVFFVKPLIYSHSFNESNYEMYLDMFMFMCNHCYITSSRDNHVTFTLLLFIVHEFKIINKMKVYC